MLAKMAKWNFRLSIIAGSKPAPYAYAVSVSLVLLALVSRLLIHGLLEQRSAFILFTLAVMASSWYGGWKSGLLATLVSGALGGFFILRPFENVEGEGLTDALDLILFIVTGLGISWIAEELRIARIKAEAGEQTAKAAHRQIADMLDGISDGFQALDSEFRFVYMNTAAERMVGRGRQALLGKNAFQELPEFFGPALEEKLRDAVQSRAAAQFESHFEKLNHWLELNVYPSGTGGLSLYFTDITNRKKAPHSNALSGLLPMCANCKRIRDREGRWEMVEVYIQEHADVEFTHGMCPDCIRRLYPELANLP